MTTSSITPIAAAVTVRDVCVHYATNVALAPTTFDLDAGSSVALVGANGSGKTTLLSLMAGLLTPTDGTATTRGRVALVPQHRHHHRWMPLSVDEVIRIGRYGDRGLLGRITAADRRIVADTADELEVAHLLGRAFGELSGGQQQRVLVAQALAAVPDVLLLDEPVTGLDLPSQLRILDVIGRHRAGGGIAVYSTHHLAEARRADRVLLLAGCVLADGPPGDVLVPHLLAEAFGGRVIRDDGSTVVVDDHGHDHDDHGPHELGPHHEFHAHEHHHHHHHHGHDDHDGEGAP